MRPKALFSVNAAPFDAAAEGLSGDPRAPFLDFYTSSALLPLSAPGKASRTQESRHAATARADAQAAVESAPRRRRAAGLRAVAVCFVAARHVPPFPRRAATFRARPTPAASATSSCPRGRCTSCRRARGRPARAGSSHRIRRGGRWSTVISGDPRRRPARGA
jgi:hypothetical protein